MMSLLAIIGFTILQFLCGLGIFSLFKVKIEIRAVLIAVAVLLGIAVFSIVPFIMQLLFIPLTYINILIALCLATALLNFRFQYSRTLLRDLFRNIQFNIKAYELPILGLLIFIMFQSIWRCYYMPPFARDLTSGAEVIAEYATREHSLINSVFSVNLESTNNQFKPAYIACLQVIYKFAGFAFGQVWLSSIFICFTVLLYHTLAQRVHKIIAGFFLLMLMSAHDLYAYTFLVLFDYSNAVYFFLCCYFLLYFFNTRENKYLYVSAVFLAIATYVRSETILLAAFFVPLFLYKLSKQKQRWIPRLRILTIFFLPALVAYLLSITLYIKYYLPVHYNVVGAFTQHLDNLYPFLERFKEVNSFLIFGTSDENMPADPDTGKLLSYATAFTQGSLPCIQFYGYFFFLFIGFIVLDRIFYRKNKLSAEAKFWIYAILVIYIGLPFLGYLLPLMDLKNTTKRGLFKMLPLILFYISCTPLVQRISNHLYKLDTK